MFDNLVEGCGVTVCIIIIVIALLYTVYFGNALIITGVIALPIIAIAVIVKVVQVIYKSEQLQEVTKHRAARKQSLIEELRIKQQEWAL